MRVIITGMHRSGTSVVAALLGMCGLEIGSNFRKPLPDNPKGFFEDLEFKSINKKIIHNNTSKKGSLFIPPQSPFKDSGETRDMIRTFLKKWKGLGPVGWKDPRASLTVHIWKIYIPNLKVVVCIRPPIEIAESLRARNGINILDGIVLAKAYLNTLNSHLILNRIPAFYIQYHDLLEDWRGCLPRLCSDLAISGPKDEKAIDDFIEPSLWHERQGA